MSLRFTMACVALAALPVLVGAQDVRVGGVLQTYSISDPERVRLESVSLFSAPFSGRVDLVGATRVTVDGAYADANATLPNGRRAEIAGMVDTRVALEARAGAFTLTASGWVPTGDVIGTSEEATVVGLLASDLLPFAVTSWGSGGALAGDLDFTHRWGRSTLGVSMGYVAVAGSSPLGSDGFVYRPGSQVRARALVGAGVGEAGELTVLTGVQRFGIDSYDAENLFEPGLRAEVLAAYVFPVGAREAARVYGGVRHVGAGSLDWLPGTEPGALSAFPGASEPPAKQVIRTGLEMRAARDPWTIIPNGDVRILRSADGSGQGWLASIGTGVDRLLEGERFGQRVVARASLRVHVGSVVPYAGAESKVFGWAGGLELRYEGGR